MRFKFVRSIETQDNKKADHLKVNSYGPRTYFKLEVKENCKAIFSLNQEDEDEIGIAKTRPNTDLGLILMKKEKGMFKLLNYIEPRKQREVFWEVDLSAGDYYMVPKSFGRNVMGRKGFLGHGTIAPEAQMFNELISQKTFMIKKMDERMTSLGEDDYNERSMFVRSVIEDIFRKLDKEIRGTLTEKEFMKVRRYFIGDFVKMPFKDIVKKYELKLVNGKEPQVLTITGFKRFFKDMIKISSDVKKILEMFNNLGYDSQLFSFKSRVIVFGLCSTKKIIVKTKDALKGKRLLFVCFNKEFLFLKN
jgi:hypothetical protein